MSLKGKRIGILVEADYQDLEVHYPRLRLLEEQADVIIVGTGTATEYRGKYGYPVAVDIDIHKLDPATLDAIIIPGGWAPDRLRQSKWMVELVRYCAKSGKVIGCICHGGWLLASADVVRGKTLTSYHAIRDDMTNAGANWVDNEVVVDGKLITSRKPDDLPAFVKAIIKALQG
jgi:protease I